MENFSLNLPYTVKTIRSEEINSNFSIVLLTKNNEEDLPKLLQTLEEYKNNEGEVVILDLGSNDNTINIATEWGCKVENGLSFTRTIDEEMTSLINERFCKDPIGIVKEGDVYTDFSGARNYASTLASNDMILMLDPKSMLLVFNFGEIKNQLKAYNRLLFTSHHKKDGICEFYNRTQFKWKNLICEKLFLNQGEERQGQIPYNDLRVHFFDSDNKENLAELAVNSFLETDEKIARNFAKELHKKELFNSAIELFNLHIKLSESKIDKSDSFVCIGDCFGEIGKTEESLIFYNKAYLEYSGWRTPLYKLGEYFYLNNEWDKCIFYLEGCLNIEKPEDIEENPFIYKDGPYSMLYVAYWWFGDIKKGKYYFDKALEIDPYNPIYLSETEYHYEYKGNNIVGFLSFQETQELYKLGKKYNSIIEIYPENTRGTHALLAGSDGLITVVTDIYKDQFSENLENPGNLRIISSSELQEIQDEMFDVMIINFENYPENIIRDRLFNWEFKAKKLIYGYGYKSTKKVIDEYLEISGAIGENMWYKEISQFEKVVIYTRKKSSKIFRHE
jgi:tetratricopeptide (TPR) repeat protein